MAVAAAPSTGTAVRTFADLRRAHGPYQVAFAKRAGLTQNEVSLYERGRRTPRPEKIESIARALGIDVGVVLVAVEGTLQESRDPYVRATHELVALTRDVYVHGKPVRPMVVSSSVLQFATRMVTVLRDGPGADWPLIASTAGESLRHLEGWEHDADLAGARAALLGVHEACTYVALTRRERVRARSLLGLAGVLASEAVRGNPVDSWYAEFVRQVPLAAVDDPGAFQGANEEAQLALLDAARKVPAHVAAHLDTATSFLEGAWTAVWRQPMTDEEIDAAEKATPEASTPARELETAR